MDAEIIYVTLASNDNTSGGDAANFTNNFSVPIDLPGPDWQVALFSATFAPKPGVSVVFVNASIVENVVTVGSTQTNMLRQILVNDSGGVSVQWETPALLQWVPCNVSGTLTQVAIELTDENGDPLALEVGSVTFLTVALRPTMFGKTRKRY
jgi:hypothetical protein